MSVDDLSKPLKTWSHLAANKRRPTEYEIVSTNIGPFGGNHTPEYHAMNPTELIPTISDRGAAIWESNTIIRYLASRYRGEALYPADPVARARVDQWLDWEVGAIAVTIFPVFWGLIRTPEPERDMTAIGKGMEKLSELWQLLDEQLGNRPFVAGESLTLADIALGNSIHRWFSFPIERPVLFSLWRWYQRLLERPAYREHVAKPVV